MPQKPYNLPEGRFQRKLARSATPAAATDQRGGRFSFQETAKI